MITLSPPHPTSVLSVECEKGRGREEMLSLSATLNLGPEGGRGEAYRVTLNSMNPNSPYPPPRPPHSPLPRPLRHLHHRLPHHSSH
jgi:hypothetical protein